MSLFEELGLVAGCTPAQFENFTRRLPSQWIDAALAATGTATLRKRR